MQIDNRPFWVALPQHLREALTESDVGLFGITVQTGAKILEYCHNHGITPWPGVCFDACDMYMEWEAMGTELTIWHEEIVIDSLWNERTIKTVLDATTHLDRLYNNHRRRQQLDDVHRLQ